MAHDATIRPKDVQEYFPQIYLTLISIIQGVALGILANEVFNNLSESSPDWGIIIPHGIISFGILIIVSFEYTIFIATMREYITIFDTIIPLVLGAAEISSFFFLNNSAAWFFINAILCMLGAIAFQWTLHLHTKHYGQSKDPFRLLKHSIIADVRYCLVGAVVFYVMWSTSLFGDLKSWENGLFHLIILFIIVRLLVKDSRSFSSFLRGLENPDKAQGSEDPGGNQN